MAATIGSPCIVQIGEVAGQVWHTLAEEGPLSLAKLCADRGGSSRCRDAGRRLAGPRE